MKKLGDYNIWYNVDATAPYSGSSGDLYYIDRPGYNDTTDWRNNTGHDINSFYVDPDIKQSDFTYFGAGSILKTYEGDTTLFRPTYDYFGTVRDTPYSTVGAVQDP